MDKKEHKEQTIATLDCFQGFTPEQLEIINTNKTKIDYYRKEIVFKQGAFASHVLLVTSGLVRIFLQTGRDKQLNIRLAKAGDFMAFSSLFGESIYPYSGIALKDTTVCMIEKNALKELLLKYPTFALNITSKHFRNESRYIDLIQSISYKQMRGKLASALLYLTNDEFKSENALHILTRQEIADFASIGIESAIKFIKEFEKEEMLNLEGKLINISNRTALTELSRKG